MTTYHFSKGHMMIKSELELAYVKLEEAYERMNAEESDVTKAEYRSAYFEYDRVYGESGAWREA